jgi:hypothetical protein
MPGGTQRRQTALGQLLGDKNPRHYSLSTFAIRVTPSTRSSSDSA